MDLVVRVKDLYNFSLKHKWLNLGALFCVAQASGIQVSDSRWGLDPSWVWVTSQATREMLFQSQNFIWTYGPLGFLDFVPNDWRVGFILSTLFALFSTLFLFYSTYFLWLTKTRGSTKSLISTILLTTFVDILTPPSVGLVFGMTSLLLLSYLTGSYFRNKLMLQCMAMTTAMLFYLKIFPFALFLIIVTGMIMRTNNSRKFQDYGIFVSSLITYILGLAILLKFSIPSFIFWFSGYMEMLMGYKAMSIEQAGRREYLSAFILIAYILYATRRFSRSWSLLITCIFSTLLFFTYGFTRHDAHSQTTFVWLTYLIFAIPHFQRLRVKVFPVMILLLTLPLEILQIPNFINRIQTGPVEVIKSIDPRYAKRILDSDRSKLVNAANLSPQFLNLVKERTISILPWDQLIAKGYGFNFVTLPIPQPYSVYTPKLDAINARFVQGETSPDFILLNGPDAIDGRNPIWEGPLTNIAILCNYHTVLSDSEYLLLEKNKTSACDYSKSIENTSSVNNSGEYIEIVEVLDSTDNLSKLKKLFFKQFGSEVLQVNNKDWNFVSANRKYLILNVPQSLDYPGKWKIGDSNTVTKTETAVRKQLVKVNTQIERIPSG
jgi:hypothetical protein